MDGSSSAPDSDREFSELVEKRPRESDTDRELRELRARAYGPDSDIQADPTALARLMALEAAHVAAGATAVGSRRGTTVAGGAPSRADEARLALAPAAHAAQPTIEVRAMAPSAAHPRSRSRRARTISRSAWLIGGAAVSIIIFVLVMVWLNVPRPDATLHLVDDKESSELVDVMEYQQWGADAATLRRFESFHDVDVWSIENGLGYICLSAWDRQTGRFEWQCVPPGIEVALYVVIPRQATGRFGSLPVGSFISLHLRESTVDVYLDDPRTAD